MDSMYFKDYRGQSGYGATLYFKPPENTDGLYEMLIPLEGISTVFGSKETFDINLLNVAYKSKVEGKYGTDSVDIDFLWHRDNIIRLQKYAETLMKFLVVYGDFTAYSFTAKYSLRPNDSEADIQNGTIILTPYSVDETFITDARDLLKMTVAFAEPVKDSITFNSETTSYSFTVATLPTNAGITGTSNNDVFTVTAGDPTDYGGVVTHTITISTTAKETAYGIITLTASCDDYADWSTTIAVEYVD